MGYSVEDLPVRRRTTEEDTITDVDVSKWNESHVCAYGSGEGRPKMAGLADTTYRF